MTSQREVQVAEQSSKDPHQPRPFHCAPQEGRLMAAVVAKNAVGSSWRKTLGSREWSRVPGACGPPTQPARPPA